jgi:transmembrane sensor
MSQRKRHRDRITDEAALWFARAQDPDFSAADKKALADWLAGSAEHVREYLGLAALAGDIGELEGTVSIKELIERASSEGEGVNVLPLSRTVHGEGRRSVLVSMAGSLDQLDTRGDLNKGSWHGARTRLRTGRGFLKQSRSPRLLWSAAASVALAIAAGAALYVHSMGPDVYATALGEQRSVRLEDGSIVTLNAQSTIEVAFSDARRDVRLLSGEVLFDVEKDPARPFQVLASGTTIRAVGTAFNVRHRGEGTTVTVVEGTVEVASLGSAPGNEPAARELQEPSGAVAELAGDGGVGGDATGSATLNRTMAAPVTPVRVTVGQQARVSAGRVAVIDTNVSKVTAWRDRRLVFEGWPLSKVVAEFNLYNDQPIVIGNKALAARSISGAFDADDWNSFALFLQEAGIAKAEIRADGTIALHGADAAR